MCSGGVEAKRVEVACMRARRAPQPATDGDGDAERGEGRDRVAQREHTEEHDQHLG